VSSGATPGPADDAPTPANSTTRSQRLKRLLFGGPLALGDPRLLHRISLGAFLAWVGLGADGLSSSSYGPDEAFRALGEHTYLAVLLAAATAFTVFVISYSYSKIIELFPFGGGGYAVATKFFGNPAGVLSGTALVVDYVLTIAVSVAGGGEAVFSFVPVRYQAFKLPLEFAAIFVLMVLNIRGVKESVTILLPLFLLFVATHLVLIVGGVFSHIGRIPEVVGEVHDGFAHGIAGLGAWGLFLLLIRAYSMGSGTYTGIEAVSNGIGIMREPRIATGKRTMAYMAGSLAFTAGGIILCYLLFGVSPVEGKTMNAVLVETFARGWSLGPLPLGHLFVIVTLSSEAVLLFVAAQAGFTDGPRVMANMAVHSWHPHRFAALSHRLTMHDGVLLMSGGSMAMLLYTRGRVSDLVVMYSINVFLTFSLSQLAMCRHWILVRNEESAWRKRLAIHGTGLLLCVSILAITIAEKFRVGGWLTLVITGSAIVLCVVIKRHYKQTYAALALLEKELGDLPPSSRAGGPLEFDITKPTAILLVGSYGGLGVHSLLNIHRVFPGYFHNVLFVSVGVLDTGNFKGIDCVKDLEQKVEGDLKRYVALAGSLGWPAAYEMALGTEAVEQAEALCRGLTKKYPRAVIFAGKLIFRRERWYQRLLHNETAFAVQRRLQLDGIPMTVLPARLS